MNVQLLRTAAPAVDRMFGTIRGRPAGAAGRPHSIRALLSGNPTTKASMSSASFTRTISASVAGPNFAAMSRVIRETGLLRRSRWFYALLLGALFAGLGGAITGFILLGDSWFQLLIAGALGLLFTQFAFFSHEAAHRQVLASGPANDRLGRIIGTAMAGMSYQWWMTKHTRHHANPNRIGKDPDVDPDTISFHRETAASRRGLLAVFTRIQGYLLFPMLAFEGVNLHARSVASLVERRKVDGRALELTILALRFGILLTAVFLVLPLGMAFAFMGVQLAVFGIYMGASFAPNHVGMPFVSRDAKLDFLSKQVLTSRNITGGFGMTILMGGLNHQVEHHLFPNMPRPHLARAREIVREHCLQHDVPYTETSLPAAWLRVIRHLNVVGRAAPRIFECPVAMRFSGS
jgi:fatty acid desaturase